MWDIVPYSTYFTYYFIYYLTYFIYFIYYSILATLGFTCFVIHEGHGTSNSETCCPSGPLRYI